MKNLKCVLVLSALCFVQFAFSADDKYTTKYDNIDLDEILNNKRLLNSYVDCALEKGTCTSEMQQLKEAALESLTNDCKKCSDLQKERAKKVFKHLIEKEPEIFKQIEAKYDPEGNYRKKYKVEAEKEGLVLP